MWVAQLPRMLCLLLWGLCACNAELPGEEVGTFRVTRHLLGQDCGEGAVHLRDGHSFRAQLRADEHRAYWRIAGGGGMTEGTRQDGGFRFDLTSEVARSEEGAATFCRLVQREELTVEVLGSADETDAGAGSPEGLAGEHLLRIEPAEGDDCAVALMPQGPFERLPCQVRYELAGEPVASF